MEKKNLIKIINYVNNIYMSQTYKPKKRKRAKTHGFLSRKKTVKGAKTLLRRLRKGRKRLSTVSQKARIK